MPEIAQFSFTPIVNDFGEVTLKPNLPLELSRQERIVAAVGLLDTGAEISVLPYSLGHQLGLIWKPSAANITLGGKLAGLLAQPAAAKPLLKGCLPHIWRLPGFNQTMCRSYSARPIFSWSSMFVSTAQEKGSRFA